MTTFHRTLRSFVAALGVAFLSGCYSYVPVAQPRPGSTVRIRVPVRSAVQSANAPAETVDVEGVVVASGDSLVMETRTRREFGAFREVVELDTLRVARSGISLIEEQVFSKSKTYGMTALGVAGAAGLAVALVKAAGGQQGDQGPGGQGPGAQLRVKPIFLGILGLIRR